MQVTIRLYRQHDMDLIHMYRQDSFRFASEMKKVLISYVNGQIYSPVIPEGEPSGGYIPKYHQTHFLLNDKDPKQKEAIDLLYSLKKGMRNSFLKALFRSCLSYLPLDSFVDGDGMVMRKATIEDIDRLMRTNDVQSDQTPVSDADQKIPVQVMPPVQNKTVGTIQPAPMTGTDDSIVSNEPSEADDLFDMMANLSH